MERRRSAGRRAETQEGEVWLFGIHAVREALKNPDRRPKRLVATRNALHELGAIPLEVEEARPEEVGRHLPAGSVHQGAALLASALPNRTLEEVADLPDASRPLLLLDQVTDPHNVGAILRSAAAFGARGLVVTDRHAPRESGVLAKSASGALEHVPIARVVNLARALAGLKEVGYRIVGLDGEAEAPLADAMDAAPLALVFGAEGAGLRHLTKESCDILARLPTSGPIRSLNVSNAVAVALYAARLRVASD